MVEQLIPMLGLEVLQHEVTPPLETTPEKIVFLFENALSHAKGLTAIISFTSFLILIVVRTVKRKVASFGGRWKWAANLPEVFIVVVVSTSKLIKSPDLDWSLDIFLIVSVLSDVYDWDADGVAVLGRVAMEFGTLIDWPLTKHTLKYLKKTTSTAMYAPSFCLSTITYTHA